jgi:hypothetical protein
MLLLSTVQPHTTLQLPKHVYTITGAVAVCEGSGMQTSSCEARHGQRADARAAAVVQTPSWRRTSLSRSRPADARRDSPRRSRIASCRLLGRGGAARAPNRCTGAAQASVRACSLSHSAWTAAMRQGSSLLDAGVAAARAVGAGAGRADGGGSMPRPPYSAATAGCRLIDPHLRTSCTISSNNTEPTEPHSEDASAPLPKQSAS